VMCAGGASLLTQAYTNLDVLRNHHRCELPVALFFIGREEMPEACQRFFEERFSNLHCIDAAALPDRPVQRPNQGLGGFELKPFSLLNAPFDELLFIDGDSVPLSDPGALFDMPLYREHGNVFWPDTCMISSLVPHAAEFSDRALSDGKQRDHIQGVNPRIFDHMRLPRPSTLARASYETESGQILLDRRRCFDAVQLTWFLASRPHHFRLYFYGDTELYRLAFGIAGRHFAQIPHLSHQAGVIEGDRFLGKAMLQRDESGVPAFFHQMHRKPNPHVPCPPITHEVHDLVVDHPRPRGERNITMAAKVSELSDISEVEGPLAEVDALIRESRERLLAEIELAHLPAPPPKKWLQRRILPW
jgi:alpha 1,2-mannosyltransferase